MIYITGDTHEVYEQLYVRLANIGSANSGQNNYLIVTGDFGFVLYDTLSEKNTLNRIKELCLEKNLFIAFCDGNHENFDVLEKIPVVEFMGGKAHKVNDRIYHLMRGEIFYFTKEDSGVDASILAFGGASSLDKAWRISMEKQGAPKCWWSQEIPSQAEIENLKSNLIARDFKVDYIITHQAPLMGLGELERLEGGLRHSAEKAELLEALNYIDTAVQYKRWYFGHHHIDRNLGKYTACYQNIYCLLDDEPPRFTFGQVF